jgi:hypothetical protein
MEQLLIEISLGAALLAIGSVIGGTAAWYKGWDEGFREGYEVEVKERMGGLQLPVIASERTVVPRKLDDKL